MCDPGEAPGLVFLLFFSSACAARILVKSCVFHSVAILRLFMELDPAAV
jgi:hypothetical protein